MSEFQVSSLEANRWWQKNTVSGVLLNRLMLLFIFVPIGLVYYGLFTVSFIVFAFMVPYGFLIRYLAVRAVRQHLSLHPDAFEEFKNEGVIEC
jgi:uncharacterized protein involved in response to NO